jgi:hypothetical protein
MAGAVVAGPVMSGAMMDGDVMDGDVMAGVPATAADTAATVEPSCRITAFCARAGDAYAAFLDPMLGARPAFPEDHIDQASASFRTGVMNNLDALMNRSALSSAEREHITSALTADLDVRLRMARVQRDKMISLRDTPGPMPGPDTVQTRKATVEPQIVALCGDLQRELNAMMECGNADGVDRDAALARAGKAVLGAIKAAALSKCPDRDAFTHALLDYGTDQFVTFREILRHRPYMPQQRASMREEVYKSLQPVAEKHLARTHRRRSSQIVACPRIDALTR